LKHCSDPDNCGGKNEKKKWPGGAIIHEKLLIIPGALSIS